MNGNVFAPQAPLEESATTEASRRCPLKRALQTVYISGAKNHDFLSKVDIFVRTAKLIISLGIRVWKI